MYLYNILYSHPSVLAGYWFQDLLWLPKSVLVYVDSHSLNPWCSKVNCVIRLALPISCSTFIDSINHKLCSAMLTIPSRLVEPSDAESTDTERGGQTVGLKHSWI